MNKAALLAAKLRGLARAAGVDDLQPVVFPGGAAALGNGALWVLGDTALGARLLGPAIVLGGRHGADSINLLVDDADAAATAARRATYFAPAVAVHRIVGTALHAAPAVPRVEFAHSAPAAAFVEMIQMAGADAVVEHGVLRAEVRGLEIARVESIDGVDELVVGVGRHDREAHRMAHEVVDPAIAMAGLVRQITIGRRAGAPAGLANDLGRERWLRWIACRRPELFGATHLAPTDPPDVRDDLRAVSVAPAIGVTTDNVESVFAFSVGVDTNLVPAAADIDPTRPLLLVVPDGDEDGITATLAASLVKPARIQTVPANWPAMGD